MSLVAHAGVDHVAAAVAATALAAGYGLAWVRHPAGHRLWAWLGGLTSLVVASSPWMERLADESFTGHMVQHLVVIVVAAPLLVVARPLRTLQAAGWVPTTAAGRAAGTMWRRYGAVAGPAAFVVALFATHLTTIYDDALGNRLLHEAEHVAYLVGAVAMWAAVLGAGRASAVARIGAVFGVIAASAFLGVILLAATEPMMPTYVARLGADRALDDQRSAAALMWITGMFTTLPLLVAAVWRWASTEERIARRSEELTDLGTGRRPGREPDSRPGTRPVAR